MSAPKSPYTPSSIYSIRPPTNRNVSSTSYAETCKFVLRQRNIRILALSFVATWFLCNVFSFSPRNGLFHEIISSLSPWKMFLLVPAYVFGALPSFVLLRTTLRHEYMTVSKPYRTLATRISSLPILTIVRPVMIYAFQGFVLAFSYCISAGLREQSDPRLAPFAPSTRHPRSFNERFIFVASSNISTGIVFALSMTVFWRPRSSWPDSTTPPPHRPNFLPQLAAAIAPTLLLAGSASICSSIIYYQVRLRFWRSLLYFSCFRPYIGTFVQAKRSPLTPGLMSRALSVSVMSALIWEVLHVLVDAYFSQPIVLSQYTPDPNSCLASGVTSRERYIKHHALHELDVLAQSISPDAIACRRALFSDLKMTHPPGSVPPNGSSTTGAWAVISRECLLLLGHDYQTLLRRGTPPAQATTSASVVSASVAPAASQNHPQHESQDSVIRPAVGIFRPSLTSTSEAIADSFSSEGASTQVLSHLVESANRRVSHIQDIPNVFLSQSVSSSPTPLAKMSARFVTHPDPVASVTSNATAAFNADFQRDAQDLLRRSYEKIGRMVLQRLPLTLRWRVYDSLWVFFRSNVGRVESSLPLRKLDVWIVESLSYLVARSLDEDAYGVVQRDVPRILEAFVSFLSAVEEFSQEIQKDVSQARSELVGDDVMKWYLEHRQQKEGEMISEMIGPLLSALRAGIRIITAAFGPGLEAFKFAPNVAAQLQLVVDQL